MSVAKKAVHHATKSDVLIAYRKRARDVSKSDLTAMKTMEARHA